MKPLFLRLLAALLLAVALAVIMALAAGPALAQAPAEAPAQFPAQPPFQPSVQPSAPLPAPVPAPVQIQAQPQASAQPQAQPSAEKRLALVVGNSAYQGLPALRNPASDAKAVAAALQDIGFELVGGEALLDLDRQGLEKAIQKFGKALSGGSVGLFYYSGHGVQVDGKNYLIPVSANVERRADIKFQLVDMDVVLDEMAYANTQTNLIILDACRTNPYTARGFKGSAQGLAPMDAPRGTFIAYSTAPGKVAADGTAQNSPYSAALAEAIRKPGLRIEDVFIQVGLAVEKSSGGDQQPWQSNNLRGVFRLLPQPGQGETKAPTPAPAPSAAPAQEAAFEMKFWESAEKTGDVKDYQAYLDAYPAGKFASLARLRIEEKQAKAAEPAPEKRLGPSDSWRDPITGLAFAWVPAGCYEMGCGPWTHDCDEDERPVHLVCVDGFWMGKTEVTRTQWAKVMDPDQESQAQAAPGELPMTGVSYAQARAFIEKLSQAGGGKSKFRLPTEAEWEYACRSGGKAEVYAGGNDPDLVAWHAGLAQEGAALSAHPVGSKAPNGLGLSDLSGNVWEWIVDSCGEDAYAKHQRSNPVYLREGRCQGLRGGSFLQGASSARCSFRGASEDGAGRPDIGLRLIRLP
jgi:formylglycine-generating enzyme required for sulfatase activity